MSNQVFIKVRRPGAKRWEFVAPKGTNQLRIHACRYAEAEAEKKAREMYEKNPLLEIKVVDIYDN